VFRVGFSNCQRLNLERSEPMARKMFPHYNHKAVFVRRQRNPARTGWSRGVFLLGAVILLLLLYTLVFRAARAYSAAARAPTADTKIHLPVVWRGGPFYPTSDTQLPGQVYHFSEINIPAGITVTVTGDVSLYASGLITITGNLVGDCHLIEIYGQSNISITGKVDNHCTTSTPDPGDLVIHTRNGNLAIGTGDTPAALQTSGSLDVANAPDLQDWEFDVLPDQRSNTLLPPVCSASADTLVDTVVSGFPVEVAFFGEGADPDGGPVTYHWSFGAAMASNERDPVHAFTSWGAYDVILTVTDDEGETCRASLRIVLDDGDLNIPDDPAVWAGPHELVAPVGQALLFSEGSLDPQGGDVTYHWEFGDSLTSTVEAPTHTYTLAGRYPITLTIIDDGGYPSVATASIYVYPVPAARHSVGNAPVQGNCVIPGPNVFNVVYNGNIPPAAAGADGRSARFRGRGDIFLGGGVSIQAQDGGNGINRVGAGVVQGGRGGRGGSLQILVEGHLTVCAPAVLSAGSGGNGGTATSTTPAPGKALARGGNGGQAAHLLRIEATQGIEFQAPFGGVVALKPGSGGNGGAATATGLNGDPDCPTGDPGASARATGGNGGKASKVAIVVGNVIGLGTIEIQGGLGGHGGAGGATAGDGGAATCPGSATGGAGQPAEARGGQGGEAKLSGAFAAFGLAPDAFTAGDGGAATANGGQGGAATATPPGACQAATAVGGAAGKATAYGGHGARGRINGNGDDADATGGQGGSANATGGDCNNCGNGGDAIATGGRGGDALARYGRKGGAPAADGAANANGGDGGLGTALGGRGGDCPTCPAGKGGDGGIATATGGMGGNATGNGANTGGDGAAGDATGGRGGDGADCCGEPLAPGGNGGKGGDAFSTAGNAGAPGGVVGGNATRGGNGGDGGDGKPPGVHSNGGLGTGTPVDIPDGAPGLDGLLCLRFWFIYHSSIDDGGIIPGTTITLTVYPTASTHTTPTGSVPALFQELPGAQYLKNSNMLFVTNGGITYDLSLIPPSVFPTIGVETTILDNCGSEGCIRLTGYFEGNPVATVISQAGMGQETLSLPSPTGAPYYDAFELVCPSGSFAFDHWWIVIIDP
jgi:PKD repeat protein